MHMNHIAIKPSKKPTHFIFNLLSPLHRVGPVSLASLFAIQIQIFPRQNEAARAVAAEDLNPLFHTHLFQV
jgi:hypothetical protein